MGFNSAFKGLIYRVKLAVIIQFYNYTILQFIQFYNLYASLKMPKLKVIDQNSCLASLSLYSSIASGI